MAGIARHLSAALVAIAMIAAQVMPAWAGCHARSHAALTTVIVSVADAAEAVPGHHGMDHRSMASQMQVSPEIAATTADPTMPSPGDLCLGNCGCACGISGAFVLAGIVAIDAPHGIAISRELVSTETTHARSPDGPRRPPRLIA